MWKMGVMSKTSMIAGGESCSQCRRGLAALTAENDQES